MMLQEIFQIRGLFVNFHLIAWNNDLVLIDGGFVTDFKILEAQLANINKTFQDINLIILSHGHLDHTLNIRRIQQLSGAKVIAHAEEKAHIAGNYPYASYARICGILESLGRFLFQYQPFQIDSEITDNQRIDMAGGIRVVHLPGHTIGHCGFYHEPTQMLFTGDFYQYSWYRQGVAPFFLNSCPQYFPQSARKILELNPKGIYSNHSDNASPQIQYERFKKFFKNIAI